VASKRININVVDPCAVELIQSENF
jgi:hypothetical protein